MIRKSEYKPLLYTTTVRNPARVKSLLYILEKFDGMTLNDDLATKVVAELIKYGLYRPIKRTVGINTKWKSTLQGTFSDEILTEDEVQYVINNNPQSHKEAGFSKGFPSRFATLFDFAKELGFVYFMPGKRIEFSQIGHKLAQVYNISVVNGIITTETVHPEYEQQAFLQAMVKSQRKNPFVRVLNDNIPLILLLQTIRKLNTNKEFNTKNGEGKGISRRELPLLIFWKNNNADSLYNRIVKLRKEYGYDPSDEVICEICSEEIMNGFKAFDSNSIMRDYPDELIRKMRITGLFSLRGAGRFVDENHNEEDRINYILNKYANYKLYTDEYEYFKYMAEIDENLFNINCKKTTLSQAEGLLLNWTKIFSWDKLKNEMMILSKRGISKDDILKLLPSPVRLEFLTAICIKCRIPNIKIIPNYCCDDTGLPTSTAGGGVSDIVCFEKQYGIIVEVTMSEGRTQTMMEVWPIGRHLNDFIKNNDKEAQAIFIAPSIFQDSINQIDWLNYQKKLVIRPYKIEDFISFIEKNNELYDKSK
jgi:hypothetical protein